MKKGDKIAIVCCSNGQPAEYADSLDKLEKVVSQIGLIPVRSGHIFQKNSVFSGTAQERADSLMSFYRDRDIKAVFDISGGDIANEILPYLDFDEIAAADKMFWGYSDLTTVINAVYAKTGGKSVLYQLRNLIGSDEKNQQKNFINTVMNGRPDLFSFDCMFIQGDKMSGTIVGGNIRCLLKLAGTEYFPDMNGKVLLLEALGGTVPQMTAYLSQLKQMGVFSKVSGILLGTFTKMKAENCQPNICSLVKAFAGNAVPVAATDQIGHGSDSKAVVIGEKISLFAK